MKLTCENTPEKQLPSHVDPVFPDHIRSARHCRRSKRDNAKACAAQQDIAVHHRLNQARLAIAQISCGSEWTLARASCLRKSCASSDHLPPDSHARTTRRARPCPPVNSGYLSSFRRRAWARAAPSFVAHCRLGAPSALIVQTRVASWAPWKSGKPSATTSRRRSSTRTPGRRSRSWTRMLVDTLAPASRQTHAAQLSRGKPRRPSTPDVEQAARWWPRESSGWPHRQKAD